MGKSSAPPPPDPAETAAGQTTSNVNTAIANMLLNAQGQTTPQGELSYDFSALPELPAELGEGEGGVYRDPNGGFTMVDAETGATWSIPQVSSSIELSDTQQAILDEQNAAQLGLAGFAADQVSRLSDVYSQPFSYDGAPAGGDFSSITMPEYTSFSGPGGYATSFDYSAVPSAGRLGGMAGQGLINSVAGAGEGFIYDVDGAGEGVRRTIGYDAGAGIQGTVEGGGDRVMSIDRGNLGSDYAYELGDVGNITTTYGTDFSEDRRRVEEALLARIDPQLERDAEAQRTRLANQGINLGSAAYDRGEQLISQQANDAYYGAVLAGGQEQSRLANLERDRSYFQNAAQQQQFSQALAEANLQNQGAQFALGRELALGGFQNSAVNSQFAENLARGQFQNAAQAQTFGQHQAAAEFNNTGQAQEFGQLFGVAGLNNQARDMAFGQRLANAQLNNSAQGQAFGQALSAFDAARLAQSQQFNQNHTAALFGNEWNRQGWLDDYTVTGANNQLADQQFNAQAAMYNLGNQDRDRWINEQTNLRNQPMNEIAALLSGSSVSSPNFLPGLGVQMPNVDYAGLVQNAYGAQVGNINAENAAKGQTAGAALAALAAIAAAASDRRVKRDVRRIGRLGPVGVYLFRYIWDAASAPLRIGVMAQEVMRHLPEAVIRGPVLMVDYGRVLREWAR